MEDKKKKQLIALLLLISCFISACLLVTMPGTAGKKIENLAEVDSLIVNGLHSFNIKDTQIHLSSVRLDSSHIRNKYWVHVPPGFSKAQLHAELNQIFASFQIKTPAAVVFPEKDMTIHLLYSGTVIRSIVLRTDSDLIMRRNFGSIIIAFDERPSQILLEKIISFGEPIPLALIVRSPLEANELRKELKNRYSNIFFWLQNEDGENMLKEETLSQSLPRLKNLQQAIPNASVLCFKDLSKMSSSKYIRLLAKTSLNYIDASEAVLLDADMGRPAFRRKLNIFAEKARQNEHPTAIVMGSIESMAWLKERLADFKKAGLYIIRPREMRF